MTYASCKKVRPKVYCELLLAGCNGKYLVVTGTNGYCTSRSKLAYGSTIGTVGPPWKASPTVKVKLRFEDNNV